MAKFSSRFPELGFYVGGELRKFYNGEFSTEDKSEIEVLEKLADAQRVDNPAEVAPKEKPKAPAKKSSGK